MLPPPRVPLPKYGNTPLLMIRFPGNTASFPSNYRTPATAVNIAYVTSQYGYAYAVDTSTGGAKN